MKKILYISNVDDNTGWSVAAINYILSLDAAGYDVVVRSIKLNDKQPVLHPRIEQLKNKSTKGSEVVIQHVLPHLMEYCGSFDKNIGLFVHESDSFGICPWENYLKLMDELWVPNVYMKDKLCKDLGIPTKLIPHACDITRYNKQYQKLDIPELKDKFVFYFIGENVRRKNIADLLKAFHLEFSINEPVALLIKTTMPGQSAQQCGEQLNNFCGMIKQHLKLYAKVEDYHREIIITDFVTEEQLMAIHATGDCFVNLSYGEAFCQPLFDSMALGKPVISNDCGGPHDYLVDNDGNECGILVSNIKKSAFGALETFGDLNTGHESWWEPNLMEVRQAMRLVYENKELRDRLGENGINRSYDFSYEKVGEIMKQHLETKNEN
jgi:glycosyltransferase involved in cell wall biosynthesis